MKAVKAHMTRALPLGSMVNTCDNSGAQVIKIIAVKGHKTSKGRVPAAGIGDLIMASVKKGRPDMRKQVVPAVLVRQRRSYRRADGVMIKFEDNAAVVLKDDKGNPKGTIFKGPVAREACDRWPGIGKVARMIV